MNSSKYLSFESRIQQLDINLLPAANPTGSYTSADQDLIRAYCLLVHAEIESYIEDIIKETTQRAVDKWGLDKSKITPIIFHLAFSYKQQLNKPKEPPNSMVYKTLEELKKTIKSNNGIKENNMIAMLSPIGFEMDNTLVSLLSDFGKNRGEIAHTSFQTQQIFDPANEKSTVNTIMIGLKQFDSDLFNYENNGIPQQVTAMTNEFSHRWLICINRLLFRLFPAKS